MKNHVWLIGAGGMAADYSKVLTALDASFLVIGRGDISASGFEVTTGCQVIRGGLERYLSTKPSIPTHAIVAVGVEKLHETTIHLLRYGVKRILVEKPAGLDRQEIEAVNREAAAQNAHVFVGYNRRYYAAVIRAQEIVLADGGVTSFNFEFTEWAHVIGPLQKADGVKEKLFLNNSTHVVDLAFYLGGKPREISTYTAGGLSWHPAASVFAGAGISDCGALFCYQANWSSAGRWGVEVLTNRNRLIFRPLEKLQIQKVGSLNAEFVDCDYKYDQDFKPGLFLQTRNFMLNINCQMCTIQSHAAMVGQYYKMASYDLSSL